MHQQREAVNGRELNFVFKYIKLPYQYGGSQKYIKYIKLLWTVSKEKRTSSDKIFDEKHKNNGGNLPSPQKS